MAITGLLKLIKCAVHIALHTPFAKVIIKQTPPQATASCRMHAAVAANRCFILKEGKEGKEEDPLSRCRWSASKQATGWQVAAVCRQPAIVRARNNQARRAGCPHRDVTNTAQHACVIRPRWCVRGCGDWRRACEPTATSHRAHTQQSSKRRRLSTQRRHKVCTACMCNKAEMECTRVLIVAPRLRADDDGAKGQAGGCQLHLGAQARAGDRDERHRHARRFDAHLFSKRAKPGLRPAEPDGFSFQHSHLILLWGSTVYHVTCFAAINGS